MPPRVDEATQETLLEPAPSERRRFAGSPYFASLGPVALVAAVSCVCWLLSGVRVSEIVRFGAYEGLLVVAPGALLYAALRGPGTGNLFGLGIGWALGYVVELGGFALAGQLHAALIQPCIQGGVAVASLSALHFRRRRRGSTAEASWRSAVSVPWRWTVAGIASLAIVYIAVAYFTGTPLPGHFARVNYLPDLVFALSLAGEALHHWPLTDPSVAGVPLHYETFVSMDLAAISRVTGIALPTVLFRLYIVPLITLFAVQLAAGASTITRRRWAGPVAAALVLFVGEIHPTPTGLFVFMNDFFVLLIDSATFMFGLVLFVPVLLLSWWLGARPAQERLTDEAATRAAAWTILTLLLIAASGAKATILPVILGGSGAYVAFRWLPTRRAAARTVDGPMLKVFALALLVFVGTYVFIYQGSGASQFAVDPPGLVRVMRPTELLNPGHHAFAVAALLWVFVLLVGIAGYCGAFLGPIAAAVYVCRDWLRHPGRLFLLLTAAVSFVPTLLLSSPGWAEEYFLNYGYVALGMLAGDGVVTLLARLQLSGVDRPWFVRLAVAGAGAVIVVTALAIWAWGRNAEVTLYVVAAGTLIGVGAATVLASRYLRKRGALSRAKSMVIVPIAAVTAYGAFDAPLSVLPTLYTRWHLGQPLYPVGPKDLTPKLLAGLTWIRTHTRADSVLAANNQYLGPEHTTANFMYYSAFAERRVFLEGWWYTTGAPKVGLDRVYYDNAIVYPGRLALNNAVFARADPNALKRLVARYGVDYLVVDKFNGGPSPAIARLAKPLFSNSAVSVYSARTVLARTGSRQASR